MIREDEWKRFEVLAIDRKPFEEANAYLDDIRNVSEVAKASLKRGQQVTEVGADPIQVFEKFGLGDCGKTLPEWEKDKIVGPTYVESEEEEEDIDEMEFDGEDSGEEEEHDDEKWSDLDNDEMEVPPSSARGGKRKRGGRKEPEEEEEVMPTSGRSRRANAGKKTETYSPTKVAEEQRARQEAMQPKVVVKEEQIPFNDPEMEHALGERRKLALIARRQNRVRIFFDSSNSGGSECGKGRRRYSDSSTINTFRRRWGRKRLQNRATRIKISTRTLESLRSRTRLARPLGVA